jgi:hypothetical protein
MLIAVIAAAAIVVGGCDTISQDFNDFAQSIAPPSPSEAARMMLSPDDPDARRRGTLLIANSDFGSVDVYVRAYRDYVENERNPLVKAAAIRALAKHGEPSDASLIAEHLDHENVQVRWEAAKGLQRLHNPVVVPDLLAVLRSPSEETDVRVAAATALGQYPEDRVFQGLVAALDARALAVNDAARNALRVLTGQEYDLDPRAWLSWYNDRDGDPFAAGKDYLYPTFQRKDTLLETLAFWSSRVEEQPAPPTGLRPSGERRTYDDDPDDGSPHDEADG